MADAGPLPAYLIVHGHFYQPPRENPWSGAVERQPSAAPHHDWNARIGAECYRRLAFTRLPAPSGRVAGVANTYAAMNFNVGPTLLRWMEAHEPAAYQRILEADRESRTRFGRGGAWAQAYTHAILPLSLPRDRRTHLRWGIADFRHRFGRAPEGLWLPETAADAATLADLAAEGIRYAILAPSQAARWRRLPEGAWRDARDGPLDTRRAYRWLVRPEDPSSPGLDLLFYHEELSRGVAFEGLAANAPALAARAAAEVRAGGMVLVCSDGETYGHHHKMGHRGLAALLFREAEAAGLSVTNAAAYLAAHPPAHQVAILPVSAWSCAHGVTRWADDCGCETGGRTGWNQRWRRPLRRALERLRDEAHRLFEEHGGRLLRDPWAARDDYVHVLLARRRPRAEATRETAADALEAFLAAHAARPLAGPARADALALLEMEHHLLLAETSCAWFFADLAGIEALQNLGEAARAIELAARFAPGGLEAVFLDELRRATSNLPGEGNGRRIWELRVRPLRRSPEVALGTAALRALTGGGALAATSHGYSVVPLLTRRERLGGTPALLGQARLREPDTEEETAWAFVAHGGHPAEVRCHILPWTGEEGWRRVRAALQDAREAEALAALASFPGTILTVHHLPEDDRVAVLQGLAAEELARLREGLAEASPRAIQVHEQLRAAALAVPAWLRAQADAGALEAQARAAEAADIPALLASVERAQRDGLEVDRPAAAAALDRAVEEALGEFHRAPGTSAAGRVLDLLAAREGLGVEGEPERWDPFLALLLGALPLALDRLEAGRAREVYEEAAALLRVAEALGAELPAARVRLRPWEEWLAADPTLWP
jgi:alpha-amylase/alpha-mannosidase (GH57 family)